MSADFQTDATATPLRAACGCARPARRLFTGGLLSAGLMGAGLLSARPAAAAIPECKRSRAAGLVAADSVERQAGQEYRQMLQRAAGDRALAGGDNAQLQRLKYIANRITPFTPECNSRAGEWRWEVNLIGSRQINAFCMPGGKIAFYYGILSELQLSDDEVAMIMGHEMAHALLEHAREQMGKNTITTGALRLGAALFGLGQLGDLAAQGLGQVASLAYSRSDESEADALGLIMAAKAGYDPRAGVSLWEKMGAAGGGAPPELLSTHPAGPTRIREIQARLPNVLPIFQAAAKPDRQFGPPAKLPPAPQRQR